MEFPTHIVAGAGVVENDQGEILMVKTYNAGWVFPGGQVENGENVIEAVIREIKEESGIDVQVGPLFCIASNTGGYPGNKGYEWVPTKVMMDFICKPTGGTLSTSDETGETGWFPRDQVLSMIKAPAIIKRFQAYLAYEGQVQYMDYVTKPAFELKFHRKV